MAEADELLDLVDKNDRVIGTIWRSEKATKLKKGYHFLRAAEVFILNKKNELWIPRRGLNKSIAPGGLDYSASGHVGSGESYEQAALRELEEELHLKINAESLRPLRKFPPTRDEPLFFRSVFIYETDEEPDYNGEDFSSFEWLKPQELLKRLQNGEPAKRSLPETVQWLINHPA